MGNCFSSILAFLTQRAAAAESSDHFIRINCACFSSHVEDSVDCCDDEPVEDKEA
jgi:hypothetical protein